MSSRTMILMALLCAPFALHPVDSSAQERGSRTPAPAAAPPASEHRPTAVPAGIRRAFAGRTLPPGIRRVFPQPTPEPVPDPTPDPPPVPEEERGIEFVMLNGQFVLVDCYGNIVDPVDR